VTDAVVAQTSLPSPQAAGAEIGAKVRAAMGGGSPDALILFASAQYEYEPLLEAVQASCEPRLLVGCSSAGEFTSGRHGEGTASAIALRSADLLMSAGLGRDLSRDRGAAAQAIVGSFQGQQRGGYRYQSALVLTDALAGFADDLVEQLTRLTAGGCQFFGGGAGDDGRFSRTHVFLGTKAYTDTAVALEILSNKPLGIGVRHGWKPAGAPLRVTESDGMRLVSLNAAPAAEAFEEHARATGQAFDRAQPLPFFLHNILGIEAGGAYRLRVPLSVNPDGSVQCAAEVPEGAAVRIMGITGEDASEAAALAVASALPRLEGQRPKVALFFDCVATRLRMGRDFGFELEAVRTALGDTPYAGFNTYGQIARAEGQFGGFHNCTAVVCVIPE
jgi:hypothetical protein